MINELINGNGNNRKMNDTTRKDIFYKIPMIKGQDFVAIFLACTASLVTSRRRASYI